MPSAPGAALLPAPLGTLRAPGRALVAGSAEAGVLDRARAQLLVADWAGMVQQNDMALEQHPERARLALLLAEAHLQLGHGSLARTYAGYAAAWGCDRHYAARILIAGVHHTLARAAVATGDSLRSARHFDRSLPMALPGGETRRLLQGRHERAVERLQELRARARSGFAEPPTAAADAPDWLVDLVHTCVSASDVHEQVDRSVERLLRDPVDRARFFLLLSDEFRSRKDNMTALSFLAAARALAGSLNDGQRAGIARRLVALGKADEAMDLLLGKALEAVVDGRLSALDRSAMLTAYSKVRKVAQAGRDHGHDLMISHLRSALPALAPEAAARKLVLIEIGTTREDVPGQGSTRKLAEFCKQQGLHFITVDMDPHNSLMARQTFASLGVPFEAVTAKGEDYLRDYRGAMDFVFLDAYDFDHGNHSDMRQSRYEKFLGARIDELACHQMHLDCAQSVRTKLSAFGAVCVDDTWLDGGLWTAKGTLAMPYLLGHDFKIVVARNRAALLVRAPSGAAAPALDD